MEDRFKFRCFNKKTKKIYQVDSLHLDSEDEWVWVHYYNPIYDKELKIQIEKPNAILMQSTGLHDKNGKLIYEGDIVDVLPEIDEIAIIEWDNEEAKFIINHYFEKYISTFENYYGKDLEIIGNIYENSDLLSEVE